MSGATKRVTRPPRVLEPVKPVVARWSDFGPDDVVDDNVAARLLSVSVHTMRSWRVREPISGPRFFRLGALVRYRISDLRRYVDRAIVSTSDDPAATPMPKGGH